MSSYTKIARRVRAGSGTQSTLPYETTPNRTLFSAMGVLVSTGVIALAVGTPEAKAKSALDDMAWLPQHVPVTQGAPVMAVAAAPAAVAPVSVQHGLTAPSAVTVLPVDVESRVVSERPVNTAATVAEPTAPAASSPNRLRGFADSGLVDTVSQPAIDSPAPTSARFEPHFVAAQAQTPDLPQVGVAVSPIRPVKVAAALSPSMRMPNAQADLESLRTPAMNPVSAAQGGGSAMQPAQIHDQSAFATKDSTAVARRGQRNARSVDENFSDWLDDGSASRMRNDEAVVPEQAVRAALRNAVDAAAALSPTIKQARDDWEAAKFDVDQVKGQRYPQVQVGANSPAITGDSASFNQYNRPTANIAITTMIYDWGKTSKSIDARQKTADATEFYYQTVSQQNAYDVSQNLVELAKNRAIYAVGESYVKRMSQLVEMLVAIVKVDPGRSSELTQAKSRLLQAQTSQEIVAAQVRSLQLAVTKLVGSEPTPMPVGTKWQFQLDGLDSAVAAVATNPQIEQLTAEAESAKLNAKSVRADGLPKLNWVINKNTASDVFGNRQPWSTMLQLSWTPFQGGSQRAAERAALARADSSIDKRDQLELDSEYKVRDAHRDAIALSTRAKMYGDLATETDLIRKQFFEQWYHLNRRTLLDVLSAESDFYNNQVSATTAQFDAYQSVLKIHLNNGTFAEWLQRT